jgi:hypothetical protein
MVRAFTLQNEQLTAMAEEQRTLLASIIEERKNSDNTYSDIVSDGGLDPRTKYEADRFKRPWVFLTDEEIDELLDGMSLGCCARDVRIVQEKLKEKNNG